MSESASGDADCTDARAVSLTESRNSVPRTITSKLEKQANEKSSDHTTPENGRRRQPEEPSVPQPLWAGLGWAGLNRPVNYVGGWAAFSFQLLSLSLPSSLALSHSHEEPLLVVISGEDRGDHPHQRRPGGE